MWHFKKKSDKTCIHGYPRIHSPAVSITQRTMANEAEQMAAIMNQLIADAAAAEARAEAAEARVAELTRPPVCDNNTSQAIPYNMLYPIAEMIFGHIFSDYRYPEGGYPEIRIRLEMNSARTDLDHASKEYAEVCALEVNPFVFEANGGAQALRSAIDEYLNSGYQLLGSRCGAWRGALELLAGPQTYIFDGISYWNVPVW
eukprot:COSAG01_NODE_11230_length_1977_cov_7.581470_1_plen_200_part_10